MRSRLTSSDVETPPPRLHERGVLDLVLSTAGGGWWRWRENGNLLAAGPAIAALRGTAPTSLPQLLAQVHRDDRASVQEAITGASDAIRRLEYRIMHHDGAARWMLGSIRKIEDEEGEAIIGVEIDIDAQKRAQGDLRAHGDHVARANQDKEKFVYICSHDLREPLRMVSGFLGLLERRATGLDQRARDYLTLATDGAARLNRMLDDLLSYSRCGRSRRVEPVPLAAALDAARVELEPELAASRAMLEAADGLPALTADREQLVRLLRELLANAIRFRRGPEPRITVGVERGDGAWILGVADDGIGIGPGDRERVFEVFHRLHARDEYPGSGMGLALCAKIAEQHGGRIWIEPRADGASGTVVKASFPDG
jgi:PAS domain S-box-containing protein